MKEWRNTKAETSSFVLRPRISFKMLVSSSVIFARLFHRRIQFLYAAIFSSYCFARSDQARQRSSV